jgi:hypothetical protein
MGPMVEKRRTRSSSFAIPSLSGVDPVAMGVARREWLGLTSRGARQRVMQLQRTRSPSGTGSWESLWKLHDRHI